MNNFESFLSSVDFCFLSIEAHNFLCFSENCAGYVASRMQTIFESFFRLLIQTLLLCSCFQAGLDHFTIDWNMLSCGLWPWMASCRVRKAKRSAIITWKWLRSVVYYKWLDRCASCCRFVYLFELFPSGKLAHPCPRCLQHSCILCTRYMVLRPYCVVRSQCFFFTDSITHVQNYLILYVLILGDWWLWNWLVHEVV